MKKFLTVCFAVLCFLLQAFAQVPTNVLMQIVRAEDERRYDKTLEDLMKNANESIRARAALAAGRIGDERAVPTLINLLENDSDAVRAMAAFALGEIESAKASDSILKIFKLPQTNLAVRARLVEAAGKIAAANPKDEKSPILGDAILNVLDAEANKSKADRLTVTLGLTAILRAKPEDGDSVAAKFLTNLDARIRGDAANTLSRIKAKNADEKLRAMLLSDNSANARANAARALGAAEDKDAFNLLLEAATTDDDLRVRVSAIRALTNLKDAKAATRLLERGEKLLADYKKSKFANPIEKNELLEIAAALGRILPNSNDERAVKFLENFGTLDDYRSPEITVAFARIAPKNYDTIQKRVVAKSSWQTFSAVFQGIAELAVAPDSDEIKPIKEQAQSATLLFIKSAFSQNLAQDSALSDALTAYAAFKTEDLERVLRNGLKHKDPIVRATAAGLLADAKPNEENVKALNRAFDYSLEIDKTLNDAPLAILDALAKQDAARGALLVALNESDFLVRRKALQIIKANDLAKTDAALKIQLDKTEKNRGTVEPFNDSSRSRLGVILNTPTDYLRAVSRSNAKAIIKTEKGNFTIELLPTDAPLTVDNFIKLAKANYFNGVSVHRVVPNFVVQDGDPRGDGNGGPGWEIRDEINEIPYERGAVGMALSGKDTGGSQWFVTHSPQPHLDGGYTVFGRVNETNMKIVDTIVRGDKILTVKIVEGNSPRKNTKGRKK
ncbi:MAG: peptidylprolyl isomerase [Pyrinomonadaceae bacterium]